MNMPKSRDIQAKIPLPQAIWNFGYVTVHSVHSNENIKIICFYWIFGDIYHYEIFLS